MKVNRDRLKGKAAVKYAIFDAAQKALPDSRTWQDFIDRMKEQGIQVKIAPRDGGKGMGIVFTKGNVSMSGYQVDRRSLTFYMLNQQLYNINELLPRDQWLPDEPMISEFNSNESKSDVCLQKVSFGKSDEYVEDGSINIYDENDDSPFLDTDSAAEVASNVAAAAVELVIGPTVVPTSGGGGGGSSSGWNDDDDDEKKKKYKPRFGRH